MRDYGTGDWQGGDTTCRHIDQEYYAAQPDGEGALPIPDTGYVTYRDVCETCGARYSQRGIGLEPTFADWLANMVEVMRAVWRVLRDDGTLWLNMGDAYASNPASGGAPSAKLDGPQNATPSLSWTRPAGLKPKDLIGQPWRLAFALQDDGWYLRSDIIWHKPNPMPESVQDRPTKSHEYVFLLTKRPRYFYDAEAIREAHGPMKPPGGYTPEKAVGPQGRNGHSQWEKQRTIADSYHAAGRNKRTVWTIPTAPLKAAHFASFPPALVAPCILAGTSAHGCCAACGAPWRRVVEKTKYEPEIVADGERFVDQSRGDRLRKLNGNSQEWRDSAISRHTTGWEPGCACYDDWLEHHGANDIIPRIARTWDLWTLLLRETLMTAPVVPSTVLDPFGGAGTTALVADRLGRDAISIELNPDYMALAQARVLDDAPLLHQETDEAPVAQGWAQLALL